MASTTSGGQGFYTDDTFFTDDPFSLSVHDHNDRGMVFLDSIKSEPLSAPASPVASIALSNNTTLLASREPSSTVDCATPFSEMPPQQAFPTRSAAKCMRSNSPASPSAFGCTRTDDLAKANPYSHKIPLLQCAPPRMPFDDFGPLGSFDELVVDERFQSLTAPTPRVCSPPLQEPLAAAAAASPPRVERESRALSSTPRQSTPTTPLDTSAVCAALSSFKRSAPPPVLKMEARSRSRSSPSPARKKKKGERSNTAATTAATATATATATAATAATATATATATFWQNAATELAGASHDKCIEFVKKVLRLVTKAGTPSAMCEGVVSAFTAMSRKDKVTTLGMSGVVEGLMATMLERKDATPGFMVAFNTTLLDNTVNIDCGPNCTQPGRNTRLNTQCDGFFTVTNVKCPCIPLAVASDFLRSPLFTGGVFVHADKEPLPANGTITRYQGDVISSGEFDKLKEGDKRRTHAVQVGNAGHYLVPILVSGHPVVTNYAARVRDGGSTRSNCFLWEGCNESLWLVAKEKPISAGEELLIDFNLGGGNESDGLDDNEEFDDATFVP
jgi:hypothetical protein